LLVLGELALRYKECSDAARVRMPENPSSENLWHVGARAGAQGIDRDVVGVVDALRLQ
jgi:hypothetical protein